MQLRAGARISIKGRWSTKQPILLRGYYFAGKEPAANPQKERNSGSKFGT
jgi:hypothetical protein